MRGMGNTVRWVALSGLLLSVACGDDGGAPVGDNGDDLDSEAMAAAAMVPAEAVPSDLVFDEAAPPQADARIRLRRFVERFLIAFHRLERAARETGNTEAQALIDQARTEARLAIQDFKDHEPQSGVAHLREAARLLLEARRLLIQEMVGRDGG
ncbi:MAG TPA: hypothetical protein VIC59_09165 [Gemmatimonadota bacterium]